MNATFTKVRGPEETSGPFSQRPSRVTPAQWYRGQMRNWAGFWRARKLVAAMVGKPVDEMAETYISLAKTYRNEALKLEGRV